MKHPERYCTVCVARGRTVVATQVAAAAGGLEWYECNDHGPTDNVATVERVGLVPIAEWFRRVPGYGDN